MESAPPTPPKNSPLTPPGYPPRSSQEVAGRKVGFARPTLIIPPPQQPYKGPYSATLTIPATAGISPNAPHVPYMYSNRASEFMFSQFNGIRDFTMSTAKSGLGVGEKCSFWLYNKISSWSKKWFTHIFLSVVLCIYTIGGAVMFEYIEGRNEDKIVVGDLRKARYALIRELRNLSLILPNKHSEEEWEGYASRKLESYEESIIDVYKAHQLIAGNRGDKIWTFWNSIVYCGTIYTTIGYGHMYPTTTTGMALTIVYSIIGIPLFLIALTDFGKLFTRSIKFVWSFVRRLYYTGSCRKVRKQTHVEDIFKGAQMMYEIATFRRPSQYNADPEAAATDSNQNAMGQTTTSNTETPTTPAPSNYEIDDEFNLPISVAIFILILYIFSGAVIYCFWEGWDFFAAFYFVFISMSTIGFGDFVPRHPICMIVSIVYLVFGLALMSMCINVVQVKLSDTFKQASAKIGATMGFKVAEDDGSITTIPPEPIEIPPIHSPRKDDNDNNKTE